MMMRPTKVWLKKSGEIRTELAVQCRAALTGFSKWRRRVLPLAGRRTPLPSQNALRFACLYQLLEPAWQVWYGG
jgi:hypothetical protein